MPVLGYFTMPFCLGIWMLAELPRIYMGYVGNSEGKVPQMSAFFLLSVFPQFVVVIMLCFGQFPGVSSYGWEYTLGIIQLSMIVIELAFGYSALGKLIQRQTASFFRLVQDEEDIANERMVASGSSTVTPIGGLGVGGGASKRSPKSPGSGLQRQPSAGGRKALVASFKSD